MKLKKLLLLLSMIPTLMVAQHADRPEPGEMAQRRTQKMTEMLSLTPEQVPLVEAANLEMAAKMKDLRQTGEHSPEKREQAKAIHEAHKNTLASLLTNEQLQTLETHHGSRGEGGHGHRGKGMRQGKIHHFNPELRKEMRAYSKENIHPVLVEQREKLDALMSKKDRKKVARLRDEMQALREEGKAMHKEFKGKKGADKPCEPGSCQADKKAEFKAHREKMEPIKAEVQKIADKYATEIAGLQEEIAPAMARWEADMKAIKEKHKPADAPSQSKHNRRHEKRGKFDRMMQPVHFVLMDPTAPFPEREDRRSSSAEIPSATPTASKNIRLFPNPSTTVSNLEYEVTAAGMVKIELLDKNATAMRTLFEAHQAPGTHTLEVNTADLKNHEVYFFRVTDATGLRSKRILIRR